MFSPVGTLKYAQAIHSNIFLILIMTGASALRRSCATLSRGVELSDPLLGSVRAVLVTDKDSISLSASDMAFPFIKGGVEAR